MFEQVFFFKKKEKNKFSVRNRILKPASPKRFLEIEEPSKESQKSIYEASVILMFIRIHIHILKNLKGFKK